MFTKQKTFLSIISKTFTLKNKPMNNIDGNKCIAEFMGIPKEGIFITTNFEGKMQFSTDYQYHSSWDWLMEVVEKIESLDNGSSLLYYVSIIGSECEIRKNDFPPYDSLITVK